MAASKNQPGQVSNFPNLKNGFYHCITLIELIRKNIYGSTYLEFK